MSFATNQAREIYCAVSLKDKTLHLPPEGLHILCRYPVGWDGGYAGDFGKAVGSLGQSFWGETNISVNVAELNPCKWPSSMEHVLFLLGYPA